MNDSEHFCYDCAFKHLSTARVLWNEINMGWNNVDHISYIIGNLHAAEVHLFERHPGLVEKIRKDRKKFWDAILDGDMVKLPFDDYLKELWEEMNTFGPEDIILQEASDGKKER
jgi:hypothetical protein